MSAKNRKTVEHTAPAIDQTAESQAELDAQQEGADEAQEDSAFDGSDAEPDSDIPEGEQEEGADTDGDMVPKDEISDLGEALEESEEEQANLRERADELRMQINALRVSMNADQNNLTAMLTTRDNMPNQMLKDGFAAPVAYLEDVIGIKTKQMALLEEEFNVTAPAVTVKLRKEINQLLMRRQEIQEQINALLIEEKLYNGGKAVDEPKQASVKPKLNLDGTSASDKKAPKPSVGKLIRTPEQQAEHEDGIAKFGSQAKWVVDVLKRLTLQEAAKQPAGSVIKIADRAIAEIVHTDVNNIPGSKNGWIRSAEGQEWYADNNLILPVTLTAVPIGHKA